MIPRPIAALLILLFLWGPALADDLIGQASVVDGDTLTLRGVVLPPDGSLQIQGEISGPMAQAELLGEQLAAQLRAKGADELL